MSEILTTAEVTERFGIHENTLARWRKKGMPFYPRGEAYVYRWDEVVEWLKANNRLGYVLLAEGK